MENNAHGETRPAPGSQPGSLENLMVMPMTRERALEMIETRLADAPPDAWLLTIERELLIAIGKQRPRGGW